MFLNIASEFLRDWYAFDRKLQFPHSTIIQSANYLDIVQEGLLRILLN